MENPRGRASNRMVTRGRLLDAAAGVFARDGFHAASLEEICELAGYTRGAFYSNFESKDDLFLALIRRQNDAEAATIAEQLAAGRSPLEVALGDQSSPEERRQADLVRFEFLLYAARRPELADRLRSTGTRSATLAAIISSMGVQMPVSPEAAAGLVLAVNTQAGLDGILGGGTTLRAELFDALFRLLGVDAGSRPS